MFSAFKTNGEDFFAGDYLNNYDGFLTNYGNSFNLTSGIFTSPREGVFEFSAATYHWTQGSYKLIVEKNNIQVLQFRAYAESEYGNSDTLSFSWIMELNQGETVRLRVGNSGKFDAYGNANWVFSGKYIRDSMIQ